jgi:hypothetical protein
LNLFPATRFALDQVALDQGRGTASALVMIIVNVEAY